MRRAHWSSIDHIRATRPTWTGIARARRGVRHARRRQRRQVNAAYLASDEVELAICMKHTARQRLGSERSVEKPMARLRVKNFATSGEARNFPNGYTSVLQLDETVVGYGVYQPGFRWARDMSAMSGTPTCQLHHVGYAISGILHVLTDAGDELDIREGSVYELPPGHDAWVIGDDPFTSIDWTSARAWGPIADGVGAGVIVTIVFIDIVDSTATLREVGDEAWREQLSIHHARMRDHLNAHRGREIKTTGDGILAVFDRPVRAVRCAADLVDTSRDVGLPIRVGVHTGEVELAMDDARGLAVHTADRIMSLGGADDVMVSSTTRDLLEGSGVAFEDAGEHELKGLPGVRKVFRLRR